MNYVNGYVFIITSNVRLFSTLIMHFELKVIRTCRVINIHNYFFTEFFLIRTVLQYNNAVYL